MIVYRRSLSACTRRGPWCSRIVAAVLALLTGACVSSRERVASTPAGPAAVVAPSPVPAPPLETESRIGTEVGIDERLELLLAYAERVRGLTPAPLEAEYAQAREQHRRAPDAYSRLKLALLLGCRRAPFYDEVQARELLGQVARNGNTPGLRSLAGLWLHEREERAVLERALEDERRQRVALQKKLEQLKTMEEEFDRRRPAPMIPSR